MIYGVDVSSYQSEQFPITTPGGKGVDFVIIKATEGTGYRNPRLEGQLRRARENGLSVGFYHFGSRGYIDEQADYFMNVVRPLVRPGDHLWFDWENPDIDNAGKDHWIREVQQGMPGHRVGLYCNRSYWLDRDTTSFAGDALWIADYSVPEGKPKIQAKWTIHQFSDADGIDQNIADFESLQAMAEWAGGSVATNTDGILEALTALTQKVEELSTAVAKLQTALPGKIATELNKRLKN